MCENAPNFAHRSSPISELIVLMVLLQKSSLKIWKSHFINQPSMPTNKQRLSPKCKCLTANSALNREKKQIIVRNRSRNICVFKQITLFFKVGHLIFLWAERAGGISAVCADITADHTPIQHMSSCRGEGVHYKIAFTLSVITSRPLEARCRFRLLKEAGSRDCRRPVTGPTSGSFFTLHISCCW